MAMLHRRHELGVRARPDGKQKAVVVKSYSALLVAATGERRLVERHVSQRCLQRRSQREPRRSDGHRLLGGFGRVLKQRAAAYLAAGLCPVRHTARNERRQSPLCRAQLLHQRKGAFVKVCIAHCCVPVRARQPAGQFRHFLERAK